MSLPLVKVSGSFFFVFHLFSLNITTCFILHLCCTVLSNIILILNGFYLISVTTGSIINKFNMIRFRNNFANSLIGLQHHHTDGVEGVEGYLTVFHISLDICCFPFACEKHVFYL